jgi:hypothetical protein
MYLWLDRLYFWISVESLKQVTDLILHLGDLNLGYTICEKKALWMKCVEGVWVDNYGWPSAIL